MRRAQHGLSLTELMLSLLLGSVLVVGSVSLFAGARGTHRATEALSRAQESGRIAIDLLGAELRQAGYSAACDEPNNLLDNESEAWRAEVFDLTRPVFGWSGDPDGLGLSNQLADTDALLIKHAALSSSAMASGETATNHSSVNLTGVSGVSEDQIVLIADAQGCDLFQNRSNDKASALSRGVGNNPGNKVPGSNAFSHTYDEYMDIQLFSSNVYYVGRKAGQAPALWRKPFSRGAAPVQELIEGISHLFVCYGIDSDEDELVDNHVAIDAVDDWDRVRSVHLTVIAVGPNPGTAEQPQTATIADCGGEDETVYIPERRHAAVFSTSVALRNRLPVL
ncbi:MAG: PilW family protein [Azoarcus sp.]|nr:PilW family protein [Azoarcus sp.]